MQSSKKAHDTKTKQFYRKGLDTLLIVSVLSSWCQHCLKQTWNYILVLYMQYCCNSKCLSVCSELHHLSHFLHPRFPRTKSSAEDVVCLPFWSCLLSLWSDLDLLIFISSHSLCWKAHWIMSVISISWFSCGLSPVLGQAHIIEFPNLRLLTPPERFWEIKIFLVSWINI